MLILFFKIIIWIITDTIFKYFIFIATVLNVPDFIIWLYI